MGWFENLRPASFRGVPFHITGHETEGFQRRVVLHQFPLRDEPVAEDLGADAKRIRLDAYVIGEIGTPGSDDYFPQRNALQIACELPGSGALVHPTLGTLIVLCTRCSMSERLGRGGMATFQLEFLEAGLNSFPVEVDDTGEATVAAVVEARDTTEAGFVEVFGAQVGVPQYITDSIIALGNVAAVEMDRAADFMPQLSGLDVFKLSIGDYQATLPQLVDDAVALASGTSDLVEQLSGLSADPLVTLGVMEQLAKFGTTFVPVPETTENRKVQRIQTDQITRLVRRSAGIEAARRVVEIPIDSQEAGEQLRQRMLDLLDPMVFEAADAQEDDTADALQQVLVAVSRDLTARGARVADLELITLLRSIPAVVLAYRLYGDSTRDVDIVARNDVENPNFLPSGEVLEVLSG